MFQRCILPLSSGLSLPLFCYTLKQLVAALENKFSTHDLGLLQRGLVPESKQALWVAEALGAVPILLRPE
jgi:hypothetical protein